MATKRSKSQKQVDTVTHEKTGIKIPIMLDASNMKFYASSNVLGGMMEDFDGKALRDRVMAKLNEVAVAVWESVIELTYSPGSTVDKVPDGFSRRFRSPVKNPNKFEIDMTFSFRRIWITQRGSMCPLVCEKWDYMDNGIDKRGDLAKDFNWSTSKNGKFTVPAHIKGEYSYNPNRSVLPYTEELWTALTAIHSQLSAARDALHNLITQDDGAQILSLGTGGVLALSSGKPEPSIETAAD